MVFLVRVEDHLCNASRGVASQLLGVRRQAKRLRSGGAHDVHHQAANQPTNQHTKKRQLVKRMHGGCCLFGRKKKGNDVGRLSLLFGARRVMQRSRSIDGKLRWRWEQRIQAGKLVVVVDGQFH